MTFNVRSIIILYTVYIQPSFSQRQSESVCYKNEKNLIVEQISEPRLHGEGPHWSDEEQALYYVDIAAFTVHRYEPSSGRNTSVTLNDTIGAVIPVKARTGTLVLGYGRDIASLSWDGVSAEYKLNTLQEVERDKLGNRFNDGKADANGNLWIGTMGEEKPVGVVKMNQGSLYKLSNDCSIKQVVSPVSISNGIAWNSQNNLMYYIDSPTRKIDVFSYDPEKGEIKNRRVFFDFEKNRVLGVPDGMTIDTDDNLWIACWGGSKVIQVSGKTGKLLMGIDMPVERVTSVVFGGKDLSTLYVTSMRAGLNETQLSMQPKAGALFAITGLNIKGTKSKSLNLNCL